MFDGDEAKRAANPAKHGADFVDAVRIFDDPYRLERVDDRRDYAEGRLQVVGQVGRQALFVVSTMRGEARRIISARKASRDERLGYLRQRTQA